MDPVTYERRGAAALVTIDRQERRNAVDGPTAELLGEAYERFEAEDDARVMVLTGAGGVAFCAGADLKAIETFAPRLDLEDGPLGFTSIMQPGKVGSETRTITSSGSPSSERVSGMKP